MISLHPRGAVLAQHLRGNQGDSTGGDAEVSTVRFRIDSSLQTIRQHAVLVDDRFVQTNTASNHDVGKH
jgi:hypothetical protein